MKKKIAVFATGWGNEILYHFLTGAKKTFEGHNTDMYLFLCHPTLSDKDTHFRGEVNIFQLPKMENFDGALVFANGIDFQDILGDINRRCAEAKIPVVYTGNDKQNGFFVGSDNYVGCREMCDHLMDAHGAKKFIFIAGSRDNMDSNTRMRALKDAMEAHGLVLEEENIFYSNWGPNVSIEFVKKRIKEGYTPDAVVCANDSIAMLLCTGMEEFGYQVPGDIIVTGFDNDPFAQVYDPAICSVDQRFDRIGEKAAQTILDTFMGKECPLKQTIPCEFVPSESCGCTQARDFSLIRRKICKAKYMDIARESLFDQNISMMERTIMQGRTYLDLTENFRQIHYGFSGYQKDAFHIVLDPLFEQTIFNQERSLREQGYPEEMDVIFSIKENQVITDRQFETSKLVPQPFEDEESHQYLFLPLHEEEKNMGYIVFCDDFEKIAMDVRLRKYIERMNLVLGKYYRDLRVSVLHNRLVELTETDALTHVKNRTAYRQREVVMQRKMETDDTLLFAVAVFDINNLKQINDNLGHEMGDEYIIQCCRLICKIFKHSAVYRIGGDEFAVVLENEDYEHREKRMEQLNAELEEIQTKRLPSYKKVSIAFGMQEYISAKDKEYADVFKKADEAMYRKKAEMKKQNAVSL